MLVESQVLNFKNKSMEILEEYDTLKVVITSTANYFNFGSI